MLIDELADWLMEQALGTSQVQNIFRGCCERLQAADVSIWRGQIGFRTLHPLFRAVTVVWKRGQDIEAVEHPHGPVSADFRRGPHYHMIERDIPMLRRRLEGEAAILDFPVLAELRDAGGSDYLAYLIPFDEARGSPLERDGVVGSWTCDRPGGFRESELQILRRIQRRLAVACKVSIKEQIARNILDAYLGRHAGQRVYEGKIERGAGERIHAVIWFSDLRGSTELSNALSMDEFLGVLNEFFEAIAGAVLDHGGEVLRFIGDAVLAIFPMGQHDLADPRECPIHQAACRTALEAARDAISRVSQRNARREAEGKNRLGFGIGLHVGDVMYGNIGVPRRVEFSVIGHAANRAAKMESLCKTLDRPLLVSHEFAEIHRDAWVDLGDHRVEPNAPPQRLFTLDGLESVPRTVPMSVPT